MNHHDQSTDQASNDRDTFSVQDENGVALRRVASKEATRYTDSLHYPLKISVKDNSNEMILAIRSIHRRAKMYIETGGGDLELLLQIRH
jgi:hypothetical protein